jgi:hypothetical protein
LRLDDAALPQPSCFAGVLGEPDERDGEGRVGEMFMDDGGVPVNRRGEQPAGDVRSTGVLRAAAWARRSLASCRPAENVVSRTWPVVST